MGVLQSWLPAVRLYAALGLLACASSQAQDIPGYSSNVYAGDHRDMALVPKYCMYTRSFREVVAGGDNQQMINAWAAQIGPTFTHLHHYCAGLIKANRGTLLSREPATRRFYLNDAIMEYDYVITRASEDFPLLPEVITKKGEALVQLGKGPLAVVEFERAIEVKADYWPPYARLGDYYKSAGDFGKARQILEAGLSKTPDATALQRRLAELDNRPGRSSSR